MRRWCLRPDGPVVRRPGRKRVSNGWFSAGRGWPAAAWDRGRPARQAMEMHSLMSCLDAMRARRPRSQGPTVGCPRKAGIRFGMKIERRRCGTRDLCRSFGPQFFVSLNPALTAGCGTHLILWVVGALRQTSGVNAFQRRSEGPIVARPGRQRLSSG